MEKNRKRVLCVIILREGKGQFRIDLYDVLFKLDCWVCDLGLFSESFGNFGYSDYFKDGLLG